MEIPNTIRKKINYECDKGIFIHNFLWKALGRRGSFFNQYLINKFQESVKKGELINGFAFIPNKEILEHTGFAITNSSIKYNIDYLKNTGIIEVESFGTEQEDFYKINLNKFFLEFIPERLKKDIHTISNLPNHPSKHQRKAINRKSKIKELENRIRLLTNELKEKESRKN